MIGAGLRHRKDSRTSISPSTMDDTCPSVNGSPFLEKEPAHTSLTPGFALTLMMWHRSGAPSSLNVPIQMNEEKC